MISQEKIKKILLSRPRNRSLSRKNKFNINSYTGNLPKKYVSPINFSKGKNSFEDTLKTETDKQVEFKYFKPSKQEKEWSEYVQK